MEEVPAGSQQSETAMRASTASVTVGGVKIGGGAPITVQSMTSTDTRDLEATRKQIAAIEEAGADLIRVAVRDMAAAEALGEIVSTTSVPLIADIHFDYRLAVEAIAQGVHKLRINPGNLRRRDHVEAVVAAAKERGVTIRVGVNAGSVPEEIRARHEGAGDVQEQMAAAMVETALGHVEMLEALDFHDTVVSLKAFDLRSTWLANRRFRKERDYPIHLGITEAGLPPSGIARSAIGIASLLQEGIGDTIRVSLTGDPVLQVRVGREVLASLDLNRSGITLVTCPTCGRCDLDLPALARSVEEQLRPIDRELRKAGRELRVAVMGCVVNGPGEAREADVGIAGGTGRGAVFVKGRPVATVPEADLVAALVGAVREYAEAN